MHNIAKQAELAQAAIGGAKQWIEDPDATNEGISKALGIAKTTMSHARMILEYGTAIELVEVTSGKVGLGAAAKTIRARLSPEDVKKVKIRKAGWNNQRRKNLQNESVIWVKLGAALSALTELPSPKDVVPLVKKNYMREVTTNQHIYAASNWMEEFVHEWSRYQSAKSAKNTSDSGGSDAASGA